MLAGNQQCARLVMSRRSLLCLALLIFGAFSSGLRAEDLAKRVVLVANRSDSDSVRVAEHYAQVRGVPAENIVALPMSTAEQITWPEFLSTIWEPLQAELVKRGWIEAQTMALTDDLGRKRLAVSGHRIVALVTCRGVPLKIEHDQTLSKDNLPWTGRSEFRTNAGAVDSELSMLAVSGGYPINAFTNNPLFSRDRPTALEMNRVVRVARLDGASPEDAMALVDRAVAAEKTGLLGRGYVDIGGPHHSGDEWLDDVAKQITTLGFDLSVDREGGTFPATSRADAAVLYFGWYAGGIDGPFALPGYRFAPGAIAFHIHSHSASTLRSSTGGWVGPLIAHGATATFGNVYEPYLELTHRPNLVLKSLARGDTLIDAAYYALPRLSWQSIVIGDPLYRPFGITLAMQQANRAKLPAPFAGYLALREAYLLDAKGKSAEALAGLRQAFRETPSLALGVAIARRLQADNDNAGAIMALNFTTLLENLPTDQWGLAHEAAQVFNACGDPAKAVSVYRHLLAVKELPREVRLSWLRAGLDVARAAKDAVETEAWEREIAQLVPPPADPAKK